MYSLFTEMIYLCHRVISIVLVMRLGLYIKRSIRIFFFHAQKTCYTTNILWPVSLPLRELCTCILCVLYDVIYCLNVYLYLIVLLVHVPTQNMNLGFNRCNRCVKPEKLFQSYIRNDEIKWRKLHRQKLYIIVMCSNWDSSIIPWIKMAFMYYG